MDLMGVEINTDANKMTKKSEIHFKATDGRRRSFIQQSMLLLKGFRFLEGWRGSQEICGYYSIFL
jgi:hypothetical protein